jgi:protease-4
MSKPEPGIIRRFFTFAWDAINFSRRFLVNLIFVMVMVVFISYLFNDDDSVKLASTTALVLDLYGTVVEQKTYRDPTTEYLNEQLKQGRKNPEVLLSDILLVINKASKDERIKVMVLDLKSMGGIGLSKLQAIGAALDSFKATGKKIIAIGDYYSQNQYYLASHADEITLNPLGGVLLNGYGYYTLYYKEALAKLKVTQHIFKVGKFKSAVEPYSRTDMSAEAKEANKAWLGALWTAYKEDVAKHRNIDSSNFDESLGPYLDKLKAVDGDFGQYALNHNWVDSLKSREEVRLQLIDLVGESYSHSYNKVDFDDYLALAKPRFKLENPLTDKVALIVAKGVIMDGYRKAGETGGDSTSKLLRQARLDSSVKAVVLRVDSPGGSAFASEVIRKEIDALQAQGIPVVASMSSVAASGGYWISASADEIWAAPTTITGSIGIYGMFMTFENSLKTLGVNSDGVATTEMASLSLFRPLKPQIGDIIQLNIEKGYQRFIGLVAKSRDMSLEAVHEIAQGRVWTGAMAHQLGLVDKLGNLQDALDSAATLASLDNYDVKLIEQELSASDKFYRDLLGVSSSEVRQQMPSNNVLSLDNVMQQITGPFEVLKQFNDPQHAYVHCEVCGVD